MKSHTQNQPLTNSQDHEIYTYLSSFFEQAVFEVIRFLISDIESYKPIRLYKRKKTLHTRIIRSGRISNRVFGYPLQLHTCRPDIRISCQILKKYACTLYQAQNSNFRIGPRDHSLTIHCINFFISVIITIFEFRID